MEEKASNWLTVSEIINTFSWNKFFKTDVLNSPNHWTVAALATEIFKGRLNINIDGSSCIMVLNPENPMFVHKGIRSLNHHETLYMISKCLQDLVDKFSLSRENLPEDKFNNIKERLRNVDFMKNVIVFLGQMLYVCMASYI